MVLPNEVKTDYYFTTDNQLIGVYGKVIEANSLSVISTIGFFENACFEDDHRESRVAKTIVISIGLILLVGAFLLLLYCFLIKRG